MIRLWDVHKTFHAGQVNELWAIRGVELHLPPRQFTILRGPSGSGKTTLLTLIGGLIRPSRGRIVVADRQVSSLPERFLTQMRRTTFGFVFQQFNLIRGLSVLDNVMLPAYPLAPPHRELMDRAHRLLARFSLTARANARVEWLSGGEAQRTALCRALINDPPVIIADEPTANLDQALSRELMILLRELKAEGRTVVVSSHDPLVWESSVVDRWVTLRDGRIVEQS